jgi:peptide/nickel transport system permease protein
MSATSTSGLPLEPPGARRAGGPKWRFARYLCRRLAYGLLVVVLVAMTVFFATRVIADPARGMLPLDATEAQVVALEHELGLDRPILTQFVDYAGDLATLDFGESYWQRTPVGELITDRLPNTALLVVIALVLAVVVAVPLGIVSARRPGSRLDQTLAAASLIGLSLPQFWLGAMLILVFSLTLGWFPTSGMGGVDNLVLPALTLGLPMLGRIAQITRTTMIDELASQHIAVARAKGLSESYVMSRHALRNVTVPILTVCSWEGVYALAGYSVIVETVFAWPGVGQLAMQAIIREDLILVQGVVMVVALIVVAVNIVTDLLYTVVDPRIELG